MRKNETARITHPENLIVGKRYKWKYPNVAGTKITETGIFVRMHAEKMPGLAALWLYFFDKGIGAEIPIDWNPNLEIREME